MKIKSIVAGSLSTANKKKISQLCRVNQDPDDISGLLGVIEMKGLKQNISAHKNALMSLHKTL
jgi:hypothetical protein